MSGVEVIRAKLTGYEPLTQIVPAVRIKAGTLPLNITVPALSVTQISDTVPLHVSGAASGRMHTSIVRVTALVAEPQTATAGTGYAGLNTIMAHILAACPHTRATVAGVNVDSIAPGTEGPDLGTDAPNWISRSRDFTVRWID